MRLLPSLLVCFVLTSFNLDAQTFPIDKLDPRLRARLAAGGEAEFLIILHQQADLRPAQQLRRKEEKGQFVYATCSALAAATQPPVCDLLKASDAPIQSFWIINAMWSRGTLALAEKVAQLPQVARVEDNPVWSRQPLPQDDAGVVADRLTPFTWGLTKINADDVWAMGYTGDNVVVGGQDTGYEWQHRAIKNKYRGWNGSTANHNYNWHDAIHALINGGSNSCGINLTAPCDDDDHGTHTIGTMTGGPSTDSIIGVAPDAQWMGCRNMEEGDGTPSTYIECFQWFVAPTDLSNSNANSAMAPHVINNSWGCPTSEGCNSGNYATMEATVNAVRAAGILVVVSAGNSGSGCSTVNSPAAIYTSSFSVGATNSSDVIANFSSRGPVTVYTSTMKPDISAPGVSVFSCIGNSNSSSTYSYATWSGTSMAGPHVAGVAALIMSARPDLKGNVNTLEDLMEDSAVPRYPSAPFCGSDNANSLPNNVYGHGRVDALAAVNAALALPVELLAFSVHDAGATALLRWSTALESRCAHFEVQRSEDGLHWQPLGQTACSAADGAGADYAFTDKSPLPGSSFYRLRQVDVGGAFRYGPLAVLHRATAQIHLRLIAQPAEQALWADLSGVEPAAGWTLALHALDGRLILALPVSSASERIAMPDLPGGLYLAHLANDRGGVLAVQKLWWP